MHICLPVCLGLDENTYLCKDSKNDLFFLLAAMIIR